MIKIIILSVIFSIFTVYALYLQLPSLLDNFRHAEPNVPLYCSENANKHGSNAVIIFGGSTSETEYLELDNKKKKYQNYINCSHPYQSFYEIEMMKKYIPRGATIIINYRNYKGTVARMSPKLYTSYFFTQKEMQNNDLLLSAHKNYFSEYLIPSLSTNTKAKLKGLIELFFPELQAQNIKNIHTRKSEKVLSEEQTKKIKNEVTQNYKLKTFVNSKTEQNLKILKYIIKYAQDNDNNIIFSKATTIHSFMLQNLGYGDPHLSYIRKLAEDYENVFLVDKNLKVDSKLFTQLGDYFYNGNHMNIAGSARFFNKSILPIHKKIMQIKKEN